MVLSLWVTCVTIYMCVCLYVCVSMSLSFCLRIWVCLCFVSITVSVCVCCMCLSVCVFICACMSIYVCVSVWLFVCPSHLIPLFLALLFRVCIYRQCRPFTFADWLKLFLSWQWPDDQQDQTHPERLLQKHPDMAAVSPRHLLTMKNS